MDNRFVKTLLLYLTVCQGALLFCLMFAAVYAGGKSWLPPGISGELFILVFWVHLLGLASIPLCVIYTAPLERKKKIVRLWSVPIVTGSLFGLLLLALAGAVSRSNGAGAWGVIGLLYVGAPVFGAMFALVIILTIAAFLPIQNHPRHLGMIFGCFLAANVTYVSGLIDHVRGWF